MKKSPPEKSTDKVVAWFAQEWTSQKGNKSLRIDYTTEYRTFSAWHSPERKSNVWHNLCESVFGQGRIAPSIESFINALQKGKGTMPVTVTSKKKGDFFTVFAHNQPEDIAPNEI